MNKAVHQ